MNERTYETKDLAGHIGIPLKWSCGEEGRRGAVAEEGLLVAG